MSLTTVRNSFPRVAGMNTLDLGATFVAGYMLSDGEMKDVFKKFGILFIIGEIVHVSLGIKTTVTDKLT